MHCFKGVITQVWCNEKVLFKQLQNMHIPKTSLKIRPRNECHVER